MKHTGNLPKSFIFYQTQKDEVGSLPEFMHTFGTFFTRHVDSLCPRELCSPFPVCS